MIGFLYWFTLVLLTISATIEAARMLHQWGEWRSRSAFLSMTTIPEHWNEARNEERDALTKAWSATIATVCNALMIAYVILSRM